MEIERKFTIKKLPEDLEQYPYHLIEQAYLNSEPTMRVRRSDDEYYFTYKGKGLLAREEYNLPMNERSYYHLREKADGTVISKKRYLIPLDEPEFRDDVPGFTGCGPLTIELDVFAEPFAPLIMAEVEFPSEAAAHAFIAPDWFDEDVTFDKRYHNSNMAMNGPSLFAE